MRQSGHVNLIGVSPAIVELGAEIERVARSDAKVLITGESGVGKDIVARAICAASPRADAAFVPVNCAGIPETLLESELFGHVKGSFTGAYRDKPGKLEMANGGTIFLDEIGDLPASVQVRLLRVLQEREFERVGGHQTLRVDVRVVAATNRDLEHDIEHGRFRADLYYRLNVFPILVPPLRERPEDIPPLIWAFLREFGEKMGKKIPTVPKKIMAALQQYRWPGNIRELRNVIEHAVIVSSGDVLQVRLPQDPPRGSDKVVTLQEVERQHIIKVLESTNGRIKGPLGAARLLGLEPSTLYGKMSKLGIPLRREKDHIQT
jgi:transcriptional regulator with GAF, ATPase, and Fis domain